MSKAMAYLGLGANLGEPIDTLRQVLHDIGHLPGIEDCVCSDFFGSAPLDAPGPHYVNAVARVHTTLAPLNLLTELQRLEAQYGRLRTADSVRNAPRTLDLDLLWYDNLNLTTPRLTLPTQGCLNARLCCVHWPNSVMILFLTVTLLRHC